MRKKIVAGNWKMNKTLQEGIELTQEINKRVKTAATDSVLVVLGTPFIHLSEANKNIDAPQIKIAAQNCATEPSGAYTGEVSAAMIVSTGSKYVILGHSERRSYYGETDETLVKKVERALENQLEIIFCVGESLAERESQRHFEVVKSQLTNGLFQLTAQQFSHIVIAYEPVWAIGTGKTATSTQAEEMHAFIRQTIAEQYTAEVAEETSILYGGSCNAKNADELFSQPNVDGGLIGGASLKADDFMAIIQARQNH
jgi:triosephosphate isomerase